MTDYPIIRTVGLDGLLVTFAPGLSDAGNRAALAFRTAVDRLGWPEIAESSSTLVSAFFRVDLIDHDPEMLRARLHEVLGDRNWLEAPLPPGRTLWTLPAVFGGPRAPQLIEAAEAAGITEAQARHDLATTELRVLTLGFAPGQPYLGHMPPAWNVPRQTELSEHVPNGAIIAAVQQLCLLLKDSPTGWRHVGQTAFRGFLPEAENPFPLTPGDVMRFVEIDAGELERIEAHGDPMAGATRDILP